VPSSISADASVNADAEIIATANNAIPNVTGNVFIEIFSKYDPYKE
jgi:hypothetical protein